MDLCQYVTFLIQQLLSGAKVKQIVGYFQRRLLESEDVRVLKDADK